MSSDEKPVVTENEIYTFEDDNDDGGGSGEDDDKDNVTAKVNGKWGTSRSSFSKGVVRKRSRDFAHRQNRIIVRNLSYRTTEKKLRKDFEKYGTLEEVNLLKRPDGRLVGCAFFQYATREESDRAVKEMDGETYMGRKVEVRYALQKVAYARQQHENKVKKEDVKEEDDVIELNLKEEEAEDEEEDDEEAESDDQDDNGVESEEEEQDESEDSDTGEKPQIKEETKDIKTKMNRKAEHSEVEEGRTVFIKNIPYDVNEKDLKEIVSQFGAVENAFINKERISMHSKGTAFVIFRLKESAQMCIMQSLQLEIGGQYVDIAPAVSKKEIQERERLRTEKQTKDSRNLYLLKEGVIMAGSPAAEGVSKTDMAQRLRLEQRNKQVLKSLHRFVSRERLTIHNIPSHYTDEKLRQMVLRFTTHSPSECRVMRENFPSFGNPAGRCRGYGFLSFKRHDMALEVLRKLNNNPSVFRKTARPIVAFSIEDLKVHNIKRQRMEKSRKNNPTYQAKLQKLQEKRQEKSRRKKEADRAMLEQAAIGAAVGIMPPKLTGKAASTTANKPTKKERQRRIEETCAPFSGEVSKKGTSGIRSDRKIMSQAKAHTERIRSEKNEARKKRIEKEKLQNRKLKDSQRTKSKMNNLEELTQEDKYFQQSMGKYRDMIGQIANRQSAGRSKWYSDS